MRDEPSRTSAREATKSHGGEKPLLAGYLLIYSRLPITRTFANSNQNRFPLDFRHTFTVILPSVTRTLDNSNSR